MMPIAKSEVGVGLNAKPMPGWIAVIPTPSDMSGLEDLPEYRDPRMKKLLEMADQADRNDQENPFTMSRKIVSAVVVEVGDGLDDCPYQKGDKVFYTSDRGLELGDRLLMIADRPFAFERDEDMERSDGG